MPKIADFVAAQEKLYGAVSGVIKTAYKSKVVNVAGQKKMVQDVIIQDETGEIKCSLWELPDAIVGDAIYISAAGSKFDNYSNANVLTISKKSTVNLSKAVGEPLQPDVTVNDLSRYITEIAESSESISFADVQNYIKKSKQNNDSLERMDIVKLLDGEFGVPYKPSKPVGKKSSGYRSLGVTSKARSLRKTTLFDMTADELRAEYPNVGSGAAQGMIDKVLMHKDSVKSRDKMTKGILVLAKAISVVSKTDAEKLLDGVKK